MTDKQREHGFAVEDYNPVSGSLYQFTLRDTHTGEAIAPLTSDQGGRMKMLMAAVDDAYRLAMSSTKELEHPTEVKRSRLYEIAQYLRGIGNDADAAHIENCAAKLFFGDQQPAQEEQDFDRDYLGQIVREAWVNWANSQPNPKEKWLVHYDDLSEDDKEADRQIGVAVASIFTPAQPSKAEPDAIDLLTRIAQGLSIIEQSEGIAGWHMNGEVSPWDEGDLPGLLEEVREFLCSHQEGE